MLDLKSVILTILTSAWGVVSVALIAMIVYRGVLAYREDDSIFLDDAEQHHYMEQQEIIGRIAQLKGPIIALSVAAGVLFLSTVGAWIYQGYTSF